jgi:hypothetical protein
MLSIKDLEQEITKSKGSKGYRRDINFSFDNGGKTLIAKLINKFDKKDLRSFDPRTLACAVEAQEKCNVKLSKIEFHMDLGDNAPYPSNLNFEALKRRISF